MPSMGSSGGAPRLMAVYRRQEWEELAHWLEAMVRRVQRRRRWSSYIRKDVWGFCREKVYYFDIRIAHLTDNRVRCIRTRISIH